MMGRRESRPSERGKIDVQIPRCGVHAGMSQEVSKCLVSGL